jgi:signal peptidase I
MMKNRRIFEDKHALEDKHKITLNALIEECLSSGNAFCLKVKTSSMSPLINPEDEICVKRVPPEDLVAGDVIVYQKDSDIYVHRLLAYKRINGLMRLITKGDNALVRDEPVCGRDYLGKAAIVNRGNRSINLENSFWRKANHLISWLSYGQSTAYSSLRKLKRIIIKVVHSH